DGGIAVFSVHGEGNFIFELYAVDDGETLAGRPVAEAADLAGLRPAALPPLERGIGMVDELLADQDLGLPSTLTFEQRDYDPSLSLDFLGRPSLTVGSDRFGFFAGGGGSAFFSDMLGNRNLSTLVQVDGSTGDVVRSTAFFASYLNRADRWNWGVLGGQIPQITRSFNLFATPRGTLLFQDFRFWQIDRELSGLLEFPFNRARRFEVSAGFRSVEFASEVRTIELTRTGAVLAETERDFVPLDTLSTLNQARASAALVYDNAIFGTTAPMVGQRYRLEVSPTVGSIDYYTLLADYRRYVMPFRPFTIAGRAMHVGRYGGGSDDHRLRDYFIGFPSLVRGYEAGSFTFQECPPVDSGPVDDPNDLQGAGFCPAFDQLLGSRIGVANLELRLPLLGGIGLIPASNVPPIDLISFFDAGIAWTRDIDPTFIDDGPRQFVRSVGVGARLNLFGLAVFELDYVNPLDRERKDWYWDFSVTPGF
ncbi:MAG: hypothetical protein R3266_15175, partial [Gemmatimonadota bacterium]|nr:hypothetical protein [Gemmatimonadota bacterium]